MIVKDFYCMSKVSLLRHLRVDGAVFPSVFAFKNVGCNNWKGSILYCFGYFCFVFLKQVLTISSYWNNILSVISIPFKLLPTQTQFAKFHANTLALGRAPEISLHVYVSPLPTPHRREKHNNCMQCGNVLVCGVCPRPGPISPADRNQDTDSGRAK